MGRVGQWLQVGANVGILIGLVLVIVQINQNSELTRWQLTQQRWTEVLGRYQTMMGENPAEVMEKAVMHPETLTYSDHIVLESYIAHVWSQRLRIRQLEALGLYDPQDWLQGFQGTGKAGTVGWPFGNAFGQALWEEYGPDAFSSDPEFRAAMDKEVRSVTAQTQKERYSRIQDKIAGLVAD